MDGSSNTVPTSTEPINLVDTSNKVPTSTEPINLVLFGRVGNGKSSLGNSIVRKTELNDAGEVVSVRVFESKISASGVTTECHMEEATFDNGQVVNVIDTPGIFDSAVSVEKLRQEIVKCMHLAKEGIHGFILVFSLRSRFSEEEKCAIKYLKDFFGEKIVNYMLIIFTGADELEGMTLGDYLSESCPQALKDVMTMCNNRVVLFDNKTKDENIREEQVQQLLSSVHMVIDENDGNPFTNEIFEELKRQALLRPEDGRNNLNMHAIYDKQINQINESIARRLDEVIEQFLKEIKRERAARQRLENAMEGMQRELNEKKGGGTCRIL
ncbi:hypothetical protein MKX03_013960 [Papaver bracteatum]|nr:hypothetical protein MKX03_013960 [Papaver bracteatum]